MLLSGPDASAKPPEPHTFKLPSEAEGVDSPFSPWVIKFNPEYRFRLVSINPLDLSGVQTTNVFWGEQRLRLNLTVARAGIAAIHMQADVLDGALFGDNGNFGGVPGVNSGVSIASKRPNVAGWDVSLSEGADPLELDIYNPVLKPLDIIEINYVYGEVLLPFGLLRIGRQPSSEGGTVFSNDGQSGRNRWGVSRYHTSADRILFATKISEAVNLLTTDDPDYEINTSLDNGVFIGFAYDFLVLDQVQVFNDDLMQFATQVQWRIKELTISDELSLTDFYFGITGTYRWNERFATGIFAMPVQLRFGLGPVHFNAEYILAYGSTREISEGFAKLTGQPITDQTLIGHAARVGLEVSLVDQLTLSLEWAFASGDDDPRATNKLTSFSWARDTNLGLLLFEHVLAFQSARSAAVGIENLQQLNAASFPITEVSTEGRVVNVNAIFPQVFWDPVPEFRLKAGALFAWTHLPAVDAIQTSLAWDGDIVEDDALNFHGGKPGSYWGTELDLGVEYRHADLFEAILEAAVLFPGDALEDENGDAVISWMLEARFVFTL